jgi:hypothetical protein
MRILFCLLNFLSVLNFNSNFNQEEIIKNNHEVDDVVAVNDKSYVSISGDDSYFYYANEEYLFDNCLIYETLDTINNIYFLCNDDNNTLVYVFNKFNKNIDNKILENIEINRLYDINNSLYLVGSHYNNGLILNLNYDLELLNERIFNSDGDILVNHLIFYEGYFYASIYKSGIANNSEFINHGNSLDMKSLIVQLDIDFNIITSYYLNENTSNEIVKNFYIEKDYLKILLKTNEGYYIYQLSKELSNLKYYYINSKNDLELLIHYKETNKDLLMIRDCQIILYVLGLSLINSNQAIKPNFSFSYLSTLFPILA